MWLNYLLNNSRLRQFFVIIKAVLRYNKYMKKILIAIGILIALFAALFITLALTGISTPKATQQQVSSQSDAYLIDGQQATVKYFGNEVTHDFNGDGVLDRVYLVTYSQGGSGTFYYVVVTLNTPNGPVNSELYLLGDRIAPQTTEVAVVGSSTQIIVNYADRSLTDSFAVAPSIGKTVRLILDPSTMKFGVVVNNFEGEANPAIMTLNQQKWNWVSTTYNDGTKIVPKISGKFILTFKKDGTFGATTDCNGVGGEYKVSGTAITFDKMMSTLMYCEGSQEQVFSKSLGEVGSFHFTSKGELIFNLKMDSGVMIFK